MPPESNKDLFHELTAMHRKMGMALDFWDGATIDTAAGTFDAVTESDSSP